MWQLLDEKKSQELHSLRPSTVCDRPIMSWNYSWEPVGIMAQGVCSSLVPKDQGAGEVDRGEAPESGV